MKIDLNRAVEVLQACGYECEEIESMRQQLAKFNDNREAAYRLHEEKCDQLRQQLDAVTTDLGRVSEEFGLPKGIGPAPGEIKRILSDLRQQLAESQKQNEELMIELCRRSMK
jgi:hypothetical protein